MFPESFAERWIHRLTKPGDVVLDPFCGRGTTALTAILTGRRAVSCDVNDVAYCLTKAKTNAPQLMRLRRRISELERRFDMDVWVGQAKNYRVFSPRIFTTNLSPAPVSEKRACLENFAR